MDSTLGRHILDRIGRTKAIFIKAVLIDTGSLDPNVLLIRPNTRFALPTMQLIWASHLKEDSIQMPKCLCLLTADRLFSFITYWWTKGQLDLVTCKALHFSDFSVTFHKSHQEAADFFNVLQIFNEVVWNDG